MKLRILILTGFSLIVNSVLAQSTAYVLMGGLTAGNQKWDNGGERELLFAGHGALSMESVDNENDNSSLIMQIGYHVKGSATRFQYFNINNGTPLGFATEKFKFNNISLMVGAKRKYDFGLSGNKKWYYFGGLRGDYTYSTNIDELSKNNINNSQFYPQVGAMRRWMAGVSIGAGLELAITELIGAELRLSICPDFTLQISQPPLSNVTNPYIPGTTYTIPGKNIRNTAVELSVGIRLLKKVVVVED